MILAFSLLLFSAQASAETLWHEWYLVTQNGAPVSLFEEKAEKRPKEKELAITQNWIEKANGRQETYIGSVSNAESLSPVAFFVERKGAKPYKVDARTKGKQLEITFKPGNPDQAKSTEMTSLTSESYLSSALSSVISQHFKTGKSSFSFTGIVEDAGDMSVDVKKGSVDIGTKEKKIGKESCRQANIVFDGKVQEWWVQKNGKACLVVFPESGTKMELSTEIAAKKALGE
jgi:hypothetical protein